jgi:tetratricopeptide (TPR) repeat protein
MHTPQFATAVLVTGCLRLLLSICLISFAASGAAAQAEMQTQSATPQDVNVLMNQAETMRQTGEVASEEQLLLRVLEVRPASIEANNMLGELMLASRRYSEAMQRFETVLVGSSQDARARMGEQQAAVRLALSARNANHGDDALLQLQRARTFLPDDVTVLTDLGIQAQAMHQLPLADDALRDALRISPSNPSALYAIARVEADQEHFEAAGEHFHTYLAQRPNDASAHYGLGHLLQMQLRTAEAKTEFERSIALQPVQTESYFQIGQMALDANRGDEAARMFTKTLDRMPRHGGALTGMGILAYREKQYASARDSLTKAVAAAPEYQPAHYYLGLALGRLGDKEGSVRELRVAADLAAKQQGKEQPAFTIPVAPH